MNKVFHAYIQPDINLFDEMFKIIYSLHNIKCSATCNCIHFNLMLIRFYIKVKMFM